MTLVFFYGLGMILFLIELVLVLLLVLEVCPTFRKIERRMLYGI